MKVRPSATAGSFYPADPIVLRNRIAGLLADADPTASDPPKGLIAPHAGIDYSGAVAASAYGSLIPIRDRIQRVLLFGPAHRVRIAGIGASTAEAFATPLGNVPVDVASVKLATRLPQVHYSDAAHRSEHSLELQLPFLQVILKQFQIVPFVVGEATAAEVAEVMELLWDGPETLIVVSSDLSHFHDYGTASRIDGETARLIESQCGEELTGRRACGFLPIRGLLKCAQARGLSVTTVDLCDSSRTTGDLSRVVGYGAFLVT